MKLLSDSQANLQALDKPLINSQIVRDTVDAQQRLGLLRSKQSESSMD